MSPGPLTFLRLKCRNMKLSEESTVSQALEAFYKNQNLDFTTTTQKINYYPLGVIKIPFLNLKARQNLLYLHDLNHLLTGFETNLEGEAQLAAFELASGFPRGNRIGYLYSPFALLPGLVLCPLRIAKAFRRGLSLKNACHLKLTKEEILNTKITDIRTALGLKNSRSLRQAEWR